MSVCPGRSNNVCAIDGESKRMRDVFRPQAMAPPEWNGDRFREPLEAHGVIVRLVRWCISHRRRVIVAWVAVAILATVVASAVGRQYATNFTLPGTEAQRALDLLKAEFPAQSGDSDTIVFQTSNGTVESPAVRAAVTKLLAEVSQDPHVVSVISPYGPRGAFEISRGGKTAFATVNFDKPANQCRLWAKRCRCLLRAAGALSVNRA
jgi:hypothetical protein